MPAGDIEKFRFALNYGADAVYLGVPLFSLRARENAFRSASDISDAIQYAHKLGKKVYMTMNIYAHNSKVDRFLDSFCEMQDLGPDGFIMTDIGLINKARKLRPEAIIHLSTQANATNWTAVEFWRDLGVKRVILPRELSIKEIAEIHKRVPDVELEAFVHGAICIAYSGRCLISNYMNHRDANQGTCTNSCRWQYNLASEKKSLVAQEQQQHAKEEQYSELKNSYYVTESNRSAKSESEQRFAVDEDEHGTYLFNSKDLCAIELLEELYNSGVVSFKSEGRTKSVYFVATVSRAYRRAIDDLVAGRPFNPENLQEIMTTANRTLMTGFMTKRPKEYGENFEDGESLPLTHRYAGRVIDYDPNQQIAWVDVRNKIQIGDEIEWLSPTNTESAFVEKLVNKKGQTVEAASGGAVVGIPCVNAVGEFSLLRQKVVQNWQDLEQPTEQQTCC